MPNWKTYEASVRLLSAIIAAHPSLQLNYKAVADKFGEGTTGKAISTRFERMRKESCWDLSNTSSSIANSPVKKPRARGTPKKKAASMTPSTEAENNENEENGGDDNSDYDVTPSKKAAINKVKNGRVSKPLSSRPARKTAAKAPTVYLEDDEDDDMVHVKSEVKSGWKEFDEDEDDIEMDEEVYDEEFDPDVA